MSNMISRRRLLAAAAGAPLVILPGLADAACPGTGCISLGGKQGSVGVIPSDYLVFTIFNPNTEKAGYQMVMSDFEGRQLRSVTGALGPGATTMLRLDPARGLVAGQRLMLHFDLRGKPDMPMAGHVEVVNRRNGRTRLTVVPNMEPAPPALLSRGGDGLISGQRLSVSLFDGRGLESGASKFRVEFVDAATRETLASFDGATSPGLGSTVEWGDGDAGFPKLEVGQRVQVLTRVSIQELESDQIGAGLEVVDADSGATLIQGRANCYSLS
jgi:hypothetical protein